MPFLTTLSVAYTAQRRGWSESKTLMAGETQSFREKTCPSDPFVNSKPHKDRTKIKIGYPRRGFQVTSLSKYKEHLPSTFNPLNAELNPICYLLALLAHHFLHVSRIRVKSLTLKLLMSYIHGAPILDVSRSHTTTQHCR